MKFEIPDLSGSIIKVIGVGGGGSNAVNHMYNLGIQGVDFIICNTDAQALAISPVPTKIQLGSSLTEGRGAGAIPEIGKNAAIENIDDIKAFLEKDTKMVFVTAGMGGGTGTGAAPVIAKVAKELGILTVGIVTVPFVFEGRKRRQQAEEGLEEMRQAVDTLLIINNDKLRDMYGNLSLRNAFAQADEVLSTAAKGIADVISVTGLINVDFNDVNTVMRDSGVAIMGSATAEGENRAHRAVEQALSSPLLNDNHIEGARYVLLNITYGNEEILMDEIAEITDYIQEEAGNTADVIWGHAYDESLGNNICVTVIATGFNVAPDTGLPKQEPEKKIHKLDEEAKEVTAVLSSPTQSFTAPIETSASESTTELSKEEEPFLVMKNTVEEEKTNEVTFELPIENNSVAQAEVIEESEEEKIRYVLLEEEEEKEDVKPVQEAKPQLGLWNAHQEEAKKEEETFKPVVSKSSVAEENENLAKDRLARIKEVTLKLKTPSGLSEMENEPAFKRRNVRLDDVPHSSEDNVSRFTLNEEVDENGNKRAGLSIGNSFLHDNVD
ncbi:MAG: cell division protein FtsZ [Flavobacteriales bacterium]